MAKNKITDEIIKEAYKISKDVYLGHIGRYNGIEELTDTGWNKNAASGYIYVFSKMMKGEIYKHIISKKGTDYYLSHINKDFGENSYKNALIAKKKHDEYIEALRAKKNPKSINLEKPEKYEKYFEKLENVFQDLEYRKKCIEKCESDYRNNDDARIFYKYIISYTKNKMSTDFINKVYRILEKFNMNQRGAKLSNFDVFTKSLMDNSDAIKSLSLQTLDTLDEDTLKILVNLFNNLNLVLTKSPLVTIAKTLHFFLPNLIVPIDRKYTCAFFRINLNRITENEKKIQLDEFINLEKSFSMFSKEYNLTEFVDSSSDWNLNIPKIIDNMIIGNTILERRT